MPVRKSIIITTEDLMTVVEAAKQLGKHITTIYRWIDNGGMVGVQFGGIMFIPTSEVERLKQAKQDKPPE